MIYFDNAATTNPKPQPVINAVMRGMHLSTNPGRSGHAPSMRASAEVYSVRKKLGDFFGCSSPERVIFTQNCTQSLNTAIRGLARPGDHIITSTLEHNSVTRVLESMSVSGLITYDAAPVYPGDDEKTVSSFKALIRQNTRIIVCTHASNVFGFTLPIQKIGELAEKAGLIFIVDAAQTAGTLDINMNEMKIDALCLPGHKGLYGPMGTGALILREDRFIKPLIFGGTGSESLSLNQPEFLPDRLESGTLNLPGIMGLGAGVDFVSQLGTQKIHGYEMNLCAELYNLLYNIKGVCIYSAFSPKNVPTVAFNISGMHSEEVADLLNRDGICVRAGYHCSHSAHNYMNTVEQGAVRVSLGIYNRKNEIKKFINSLNKIEKV